MTILSTASTFFLVSGSLSSLPAFMITSTISEEISRSGVGMRILYNNFISFFPSVAGRCG